jgi:hypothetical protein
VLGPYTCSITAQTLDASDITGPLAKCHVAPWRAPRRGAGGNPGREDYIHYRRDAKRHSSPSSLCRKMTVSSGRSFNPVARPSTDDDNSPPYSVDIESGSTLSLSISGGTLVCTGSGALRR